MKIVNILFLILFALLASISCRSDIEDDITVHIDNSSQVKIEIVDFDNKPLDKGIISIYKSDYQFSQDSVGNNGIYEGRLLQGNYKCIVTATKNKSLYSIEKIIQIIANNNSILKINPIENSGSFNINVIDKDTNAPLSNPADFGIALLAYPESNKVDSKKILLDNAQFIADLDIESHTLINEIPLYKAHTIFLFNKNTDEYFRYLISNIVQKGDIRDITVIK